MNTLFSTLISRAWKLISTHPKMAGTVFLYQFIPTLLFFSIALCIVVSTVFILPQFGIDLSTPGVFESLILRFISPTSIIILCIVGFLGGILLLSLQLTCSYLARLGLVHMIQKKKFNFLSLLREWKGVWSWAGTGLATSVYFIGTFIITVFLAIGCIYIYDPLVLVPIVGGIGVFIFLVISLAFTFPVYFFEGSRYFSATEKSREIVKNKWWKIFGNIALLALGIMLVSLALFGLESGFQYSVNLLPDSIFEYRGVTFILATVAFIYMVVQSAVNIIIQLFAILYIFELYHEYVKNPVQRKIKS